MSTHIDDAGMRSGYRRKSDNLEYRALYLAVFGFYLVSAAAHRLVPTRWRPNLDPAGVERSILGEARAAASKSLPFAFM